MHAAGATGAAVVLADCSSNAVPFYGGACVGGTCQVADAGTDATDAAVWDGNNMVFYGAPCLDACGVTPEDSSSRAETSVDASEEVPDAGASSDAADGG
jgi:hypothetical protein